MHFSKTLRYFQKIMLAISRIWLCLFFGKTSILNKMLILGQAPSDFTRHRMVRVTKPFMNGHELG